MSNLEHLRKQAKLYLRWHRERHYPVAAQIRDVLPRFRDLSDPEVLDAEFKLSDAQELVARKSGFPNWPALIQGVTRMNDSPALPTGTSVILASEPQLFVSDVEAALAFYVHKLGFKLALSYGEPPFWAQVARDGGRLNLRMVCGPVFDSGFRSREPGAVSATLTLDDAKPLFLEFQKAGVVFYQTLENRAVGRPHVRRRRSRRKLHPVRRQLDRFTGSDCNVPPPDASAPVNAHSTIHPAS